MEALAYSKRWPGGRQAAPPGPSGATAPPARAHLALVNPTPAEAPWMREIERIAIEFAGDAALDDACPRARRRALALSAQAGAGGQADRIALTAFAVDIVAAVASSLAARPSSLRAMIDRLHDAVAVPRCVLGRDVLRASQLVQLPPDSAMEVQLALVLSLAQARAAAVFSRFATGEVAMLAGAGDLDIMPESACDMAAKLISGETICARADGDLAGVAIELWQSSPAALLVFGDDVLAPERASLLEAAAPLLTLALERRQATSIGSHPEPSAADGRHGHALEQDVVTAAERRLARLRFDLHDGPQQDVLMLAEDLRLFRSQLESAASGEQDAQLLGRVDDLEARLVALDGDLRRISVSVLSPFLHRESFETSLGDLIDSFRRRGGLAPTVQLDGDFTSLTDSQHITLLGLIREALSNVREHSQADHVAIRVSCTDSGAVTASVTDDGRGFNLETTLVRAARKGRLGLVGMHERVRMLGGSTTITSKPGGPTVVEATLPPPPVGAPRRADR
jgi:signal transduction histidine kinase